MADSSGRRRRGAVDHDGRYRILGVTPGHWQVRAETAEGYRIHGSVVVSEGTVEAVLDLEVERGFTLTGRVTIGGEALAHGRIEIPRLAVTSTGPDGRFRLPGLAPGRYEFLIRGKDWPREVVRSFDLASDDEILIDLAPAEVPEE